MSRGAEAYLQMWERTLNGIRGRSCSGWKKRPLKARGIGAKLRLGAGPRGVLERAGQPRRRTRIWRWCAGGRSEVVASFGKGARVELIASDVRRHRAGGMRPAAKRIASGVFATPARRGSAFVYLTRRGRVQHAGVATAALASQPAALAAKLRRAAR
jgi:hypothetical protein